LTIAQAYAVAAEVMKRNRAQDVMTTSILSTSLGAGACIFDAAVDFVASMALGKLTLSNG
jgi:hypothetical protein